MRLRTPLTSQVLFWMGVVICLISLSSALWTLYRVHASRSWPTTQGTIWFSHVDTVIEKYRHERYKPHVSYYYTVNGEKYVSGQVWALSSIKFLGVNVPHNPSSNRRSDIEAIIARYPVGAQVTVHYNPSHPAIAALETGEPLDLNNKLGWAVVSSGVALAVLVAFHTGLPARLGRILLRPAKN